jgi:hypothetical protein
MPTCVYRHPLRTIAVTWEVEEDGIPVLTDYADANPSVGLKDVHADVLMVHTDDVITHRYPDAGFDAERESFEVDAFLPEVDVATSRLVALPCRGQLYDSTWSIVLSCPEGSITDIECDMKAIALDGEALFVGRRGLWWWCGGVDRTGQLIHLERQAHPNDEALMDHLTSMIDTAVMAGCGRRLVLFGDIVTPTLMKDVARGTQGRFDVVERSNPFRHVRATLAREHQQNLLRRSHLLGAFVGAVTPQS